MLPTMVGQLPLSPHLSAAAQTAFVLDDLKTGTLISLAQLCDDDCTALFTKYNVDIIKDDKVIITGSRMNNGLWSIPIAPSSHQANGIVRLDKTKHDLACYHHATLGSPVTSTLLRAIRRGHLATFPGLTINLISKHLPASIATALGHQDQEAQHLRSTKQLESASSDDDIAPSPDVDDVITANTPKSHHLCSMLFPNQEILKSYSDQTGKFPVPSSRGNHYIFVLYHQDTNSIHTVALPNRKAASIRDAWESIYKKLRFQGHPVHLHILDNECSQDLKDAFQSYQISFQRVPPKEHRANAAERAIRTFKNHFVSILCTVDSQFPLSEWDRLLPQATLTLNLLRSSRIHPSLSAHASMFGQFDYNRTPLAPPGTKIVAHVSAATRTSFGQHGKVGWYIGPSLEHYRCYRCYFTDTMQERDVLKVDFIPEKVPFPIFTSATYLQQTAEDMLHLLQHPIPSTPNPELTFGPPILNAYAKIADILGRAISRPNNTVPAPRVPNPVPAPRVPIPDAFPIIAPISTTSTALATTNLAQSMQYDPNIAGKMHNPATGRPETIDSLLRGPDKHIWVQSLTNEWGRCTHGLSKQRPASTAIIGNSTMIFIKPSQVPPGRKVTYANFICTMRPGKSDPCRIRMTVGGDRLDAFQDVRSPAVGITDTKLHLNSVISDAKHGARYGTADVKDFFLSSTMTTYQYMRIHRRYIPQEVIDEYNLTEEHFDSKGYAYLEIQKGMYGLKEASVLAYDQLKAHLAPYGYAPVPLTPGLWRHNKLRTTFTLAVDDFGIKYYSISDLEHLFNALETKYTLTKDLSGSSYLGLTLDWHYTENYVDISMPQYVTKALAKFRHVPPKKPQHSPHPWTAPVYGQKVQFATTDDSPFLDARATQQIQAIAGTFLYYARAVDSTILVALNEIANQQARPTMLTRAACDMLLDYLSTHPEATIRFYASDMILHVIADAAYLVLPNARSRCAGLYFLSDVSTTTPPNPRLNGAVHVLCKTIRGVPSSAAEAETGGLFINAQEAVPIKIALEEMGHPQPTTGTPLETDNSTAHDILTATVRMKRSKAFDMRYHWLKDRIAQKHFNLYWAPGKLNKADYYTKHFPPSHHKAERYQPGRLQEPTHLVNILTSHLRGCVATRSILDCPDVTSSASCPVPLRTSGHWMTSAHRLAQSLVFSTTNSLIY